MPRLQIMDTTIRDGQQSLWATRMQIGEMLPILRRWTRLAIGLSRRGAARRSTPVCVFGREPLGALALDQGEHAEHPVVDAFAWSEPGRLQALLARNRSPFHKRRAS